jgi:predicted esterase
LEVRYDIRSLDIGSGDREVDFEGLEKSSRLLEDLVAKEVSGGIKAENVVIGGFSQGT